MIHIKILDIIRKNFTQEQAGHIISILEYFSVGGKNIRSKMFAWSLNKLNCDTQPQIACCIEYLQTAFLIIDDIMDNGTTRRGKPCWHLVNPNTALKDGLLVTRLIYLLLKEIIVDENKYLEATKCLNETILISCVGQAHDAIKKNVTNWEDVLNTYNRENYEMICFGKNSAYTFYYPLKLAYIIADVEEPENLRQICDLLGLYHQTRDDYLNFFPEKSHKDGLDIQERKLTWVICRIVSDGYDENVLDYLKRGNTDYVQKKAVEYLKYYDEEIQSIMQRIKELRCKSMEPILEYCEDLLK